MYMYIHEPYMHTYIAYTVMMNHAKGCVRRTNQQHDLQHMHLSIYIYINMYKQELTKTMLLNAKEVSSLRNTTMVHNAYMVPVRERAPPPNGIPPPPLGGEKVPLADRGTTLEALALS